MTEERCPNCDGLITYDVDNSGNLIKKCSCCGYIVQQSPIIANTLWDNDMELNANLIPLTMKIDCQAIKLTLNEIEIDFNTNRQIDKIDYIVINGVKFARI